MKLTKEAKKYFEDYGESVINTMTNKKYKEVLRNLINENYKNIIMTGQPSDFTILDGDNIKEKKN